MFQKSQDKLGYIVLLGTLFCFLGLLLVVPCQAQGAPKGKIVVVTDATFTMTGGDPHTGTAAPAYVSIALTHDGLVIKRLDGRFHPALAKSWKFDGDAKSLRITLDERAKFHNGAPVTAEDVKFSYERAMRPELKSAYGGAMRRKIGGFKILDDYNMIIYFKVPYSTFLDLHNIGIVPKAYVEKVGDAEFAKHPIGAGPFRMLDFQQDVYAEYEAVDNHYRQTPHVKRVRRVCVQEDSTRMAMLKAGEADVVMLPFTTFMDVKGDPNVRIVWSRFQSMHSFAFYDLVHPEVRTPFFDVRVRRAASLALNRKAICEHVLHGAAEPWGDILAPYNPGHDPTVPLPYDPKKAKELLKEAGYPNGFDTTINGTRGIYIQAMAADLAKVGIRAKINTPEFGTYVRQMREKTLKGCGLHLNPWWAGNRHPGAALYSTLSSTTPWSYYTLPEVEALLDQLDSCTEEKEMAAVARKMSKIYRDSEIRYMLWALHIPTGLSKRVKYWEPNPGAYVPTNMEFLELVD